MGGAYSYVVDYAQGSGFNVLLFAAVVGAAFGVAYAIVGPGGQTVAVGGSILLAFVVAGGLVMFSKSETFPSFQYASIFAMYLPISYVMVGILSDIVSQRFNESISSIAAIAAILLNYGISSLATSSGLTTQKLQEATSVSGDISTLYKRVYQGCTVPGFENLESIFAPQSFVVIWTLFFYFLTNIKTTNSGQSISGLGGLTATALIVQALFINQNGCLKGDYFWLNTLAVPLVSSAAIGALVGGLFAWQTPNIISAVYPAGPPPSATNMTFLCPTGTANYGGLCCPPAQHNSGGTCVDACPAGTVSVGHICMTPDQQAQAAHNGGGSYGSALPPVGSPTGGSSGGSDDNQFVCEAYKNGELITSTIAE